MQVGEIFEGGYRIIGELGRGSAANVYLGEHTEIGQRVAIKLMHTPSDRVKREGRVLAKLSSPHTVRLLAFGRTAHNEQYMIFEWVDGEPLTDYIKRAAPVYWEQTCEIVRQILVSLAEAHAQNITHRDIKPGNVMINSNLDVKVLDFGVAKVHDAPSITAVHEVPGTPRYMAPEVLQSGDVTPAADLFALGTIAHELLTGQHPNPLRELDAIISQQLSPVPYQLPPNLEIPPAFRAWFERMMAKDRSRRFADANDAIGAMPDVDQTTHEQAAIDAPMPERASGRNNDEQTQESKVVFDTGNRDKPAAVGRNKNRPPSKFLWPTMELPKINENENWSVTVLLVGFLLFASLVLAGLYQAGAFDPPRQRRHRVNDLVPDKPIMTNPDAGTQTDHVKGSLKGIAHFDNGEYVEALKVFHKIEQSDDPIEKSKIEEENYASRALNAIAEKGEKDAAEAQTLEQIEAAAHDPHIAQSLYRGDERINAIVDKLRIMGRNAEEEIAKKQREERKKREKKR